MKKLVINGKFLLNKNKRGIDRFSYEILLALDNLCNLESVELLIPNVDINNIPKLKNIKIKKYGGIFGIRFWQYIEYQYYLIKNKALSIAFQPEEAPIFNLGIVTIHDIYHERQKNQVNGLEAYIKNRYHLLINKLAIKNARIITAVSNFTKKEIIDYYKHNEKNIYITYNSCNHLFNMNMNESFLLEKYKKIIGNEYYFFLGSQEKRKNIKWICKLAEKYKEKKFILAGPPLRKSTFADDGISNIDNIEYIGYISDEEVGFFMKHCKAFLFPSFYEGFGIPPLEALVFGAKVFCSNSSCLPEIYGNNVIFFDPYDYNIDLDLLESRSIKIDKAIFKKYSWENSASVFFKQMKKLILKG